MPAAGPPDDAETKRVSTAARADEAMNWRRPDLDALMVLRSVAAFVSHELNHPIATIINRTAVLDRRLRNPVVRPSELVTDFEAIRQEARRAADVVRQLNLLGVGLSEPTLETGCRGFLREAAARVNRRYSRASISVRVECPDRELVMQCAPELLHVAVFNIASNAVEAIQEVSRTDGRLCLSASARNERIVIEVTDNGPGVDPAIADRLFEPLVTTKVRGSGLGLAIARDIADWHDGTISWEPVGPPSTGARFRIEVGRARVNAPAASRYAVSGDAGDAAERHARVGSNDRAVELEQEHARARAPHRR